MKTALVCAILITFSTAYAQDTVRSPTHDSAPVPDIVLSALNKQGVILTMRDGSHVAGIQMAFDAEHVVVVEAETSHVLTLSRPDVVSVSMWSPTTAPAAPPQLIAPPALVPSPIRFSAPTIPQKVRIVGLQIAEGPGNIMVDWEYKKFYGFAEISIGYPIIFSGDQPQFFGGGVGFGGTWRMGPATNWRFDLVGTLTPLAWGGFSIGIGVSAGFHYTAPNGFTAGFKIPIIGVAPGCNSQFGDSNDDSSGCSKVHGGANLIGNYFMQAAMLTPIMSIGYRF